MFQQVKVYLVYVWLKNSFQQKAVLFLGCGYNDRGFTLCYCVVFFKINFLKYSFRNTIRVSNSFDPDQAQHFVWPDLGTNCFQMLLADDNSR